MDPHETPAQKPRRRRGKPRVKASASESKASTATARGPKEALNPQGKTSTWSLVDIGANLTKHSAGQLRDQLARAARHGVPHIIVTGTNVKASLSAQEMASKHSALFFTAGVHPHDAKSCDASTIETLKTCFNSSPKCVAIGETGLDYDRMFSPREVQMQRFREHVQLAREIDAPLFLHERDRDAHKGPRIGSHEDFVQILSEEGMPPNRVCVHCFTGDAADLRDYVARGFYIGITGFVGMKKRGAALRQAIRDGALPLDRLMVETDAPFMRPDAEWIPEAIHDVPRESRKNEPALLPAVIYALSDCGLGTPDEIAHATTLNAQQFFPRLRLPSP